MAQLKTQLPPLKLPGDGDLADDDESDDDDAPAIEDNLVKVIRFPKRRT